MEKITRGVRRLITVGLWNPGHKEAGAVETGARII